MESRVTRLPERNRGGRSKNSGDSVCGDVRGGGRGSLKRTEGGQRGRPLSPLRGGSRGSEGGKDLDVGVVGGGSWGPKSATQGGNIRQVEFARPVLYILSYVARDVCAEGVPTSASAGRVALGSRPVPAGPLVLGSVSRGA